MKDFPLVTIVIPVFNQKRFIAKAIESALRQTYINCKLLVVDDGSTDGTAEILQMYANRISIFTQVNAGTSVAWNAALQVISDELVLGLDSDDELIPTTVEKVVAKSMECPDASVVYSDYEFIDASGNSIKVVRNPAPTAPVSQLIQLHDRLGQPNNFLPFGHVRLYRRSALLDIGGYNESYRYAEDFELMLRMASRGHIFAHIPEVIYRYRWHDTNKGVVTRREQVEEVRRCFADFRKN